MGEMENPTLIVRRTVAPMHRNASSRTEQVSQTWLGTPVSVHERRGGWLRIGTPDGYAGWVSGGACGTPPAGWQGPWLEVTDRWANFRIAPDSRLAACKLATIGTRLPYLGQNDRWTEALLPDGRRAWTESHRVARVEGLDRGSDAASVLATAHRFLGVPYLWGGCTPLGLDCSGFVQLVMRLHGLELPRDAYQQMECGQIVAPENTAAADLVFFGPQGPASARVTHIGIALGDRQFIHAAGSAEVRINELTDAAYDRIYAGTRRVLCR